MVANLLLTVLKFFDTHFTSALDHNCGGAFLSLVITIIYSTVDGKTANSPCAHLN